MYVNIEGQAAVARASDPSNFLERAQRLQDTVQKKAKWKNGLGSAWLAYSMDGPAPFRQRGPAAVGPLRLMVLQSTPFCNIDCKYCYLPDRGSTKKMDLETVRATARRVVEADVLSESVDVLWHAGEPLAVTPEFYRQAMTILRDAFPRSTSIQHHIQTNGTLLNDEWCEFLKETGVLVGLSLDGPEFVHDAVRVTRSGKGTFARVYQGLQLLRKWEISYSVLAVLTALSLRHPNELFDFFHDNQVPVVGFNLEEIEGVNLTSSLSRSHGDAVREFMSAFYDRWQQAGRGMRIREFTYNRGLLLARAGELATDESPTPYCILNVSCEGDFSTFSPELLGMKGPAEGDYLLGNVHRDDLLGALRSRKYLEISEAILRGRKMCSATCEYFRYCGGGNPSSKMAENRTFESTETMNCYLRVKQLAEVVLTKLEAEYGVTAAQSV